MNKQIFLEDLPKTSRGIDWRKSVGYTIKFIYDDIEDYITIKEYIKSKTTKHNKLLVEYKNNEYEILPDDLKTASLGRICMEITSEFKINIGDTYVDSTRNFTIIDREHRIRKNKNGYTEKSKWYKYHCNLCNIEKWDTEYHILEGRSCSCYRKSLTVAGINDIPTTAPWMIDYFQGGYDEAKLYTKQSAKKIIPKCPHCGEIHNKEIPIYSLYICNGFRCRCSDKISYAEKFMINFLNQLSIHFEYQKTSKSLFGEGRYFYDFYLPEYNCIIETHGEQHYRTSCGFFKNNKEVVDNDKLKEKLATNYGIENYIVLDCRNSKSNWIKNSIINSQLTTLLNFTENIIDWDKCELYAIKNLVKEVCDFKNKNKTMTTTEISKYFPIGRECVGNYLRIGNKYGWCNYTGQFKSVKVSKNNIEIKTYNSAKDLAESSIKDFGIKFSESMIRLSCKNNRLYKGYNLEYVS